MTTTHRAFWAYQNVATLPDRTGKYRATINRLSELYDWSEADRAEVIERASNKSRMLDPMTRAEWEALALPENRIGYCDTSDASAPITFKPWADL